MSGKLLCLLCVVLVGAGCSKGGSGSSTAPSATASSVSVTLNPNTLRVGQTAQATATALLSNGQTQPVNTGWLSDAPTVARVTDAGLVTGVANGRANVYVVSGGRQGLVAVRVVPDFLGRWSGGLVVTLCTQTGFFADAGFCDEFPAGTVTDFELLVSQTGASITATPTYGPDFTFPAVDATIQDDGRASFKTTFVEDPLTVEASWTITGATSGELVGTVDELWRVPGFDGEALLRQSILMPTRSSAALGAASTDPSVRKQLIRALLDR